jgi:hypothetical protein
MGAGSGGNWVSPPSADLKKKLNLRKEGNTPDVFNKN